MRVVEKRQLLSAEEINRTLQRLAHEIVEKSGGAKDLALVGIRRRGVPLAQRMAEPMRGFAGRRCRWAHSISHCIATIFRPLVRSQWFNPPTSISVDGGIWWLWTMFFTPDGRSARQ